MQTIDKLKDMAALCPDRQTTGICHSALMPFLSHDQALITAVDDAYTYFRKLEATESEFLRQPEAVQIHQAQDGFVNFYQPWSVNPYLPFAAKGPWIVSGCGAVIHDSGGYGMLGLGHGPEKIIGAMKQNHVMANIMTASIAQKKFVTALKKEIGHTRAFTQGNPYSHFLCLNSGSESVTVAARISDIHAKRQLSHQQRGKKAHFLSLQGSFHGRTDRPSQVSDSCLATYRRHLYSFQDRENLLTIAPNDCHALERTFNRCQKEGIWIEAMFMEPVLGEGNPGLAITSEFYALARKLTREQHSLLIIDSVQAGLRAHGCLSIMDYPGFQKLDAPDMETFSKALNAGQYPLSVLAMTTKAAELYVTGTYGNTMTTNPRALSVACAVLEALNPQMRQNIRERGEEFLHQFAGIKKDFPDVIGQIQGTGLLFSIAINPAKVRVTGDDGLEMLLRKRGLGVIHGGENSLRFTPHFGINSAEISLITGILREQLARI